MTARRGRAAATNPFDEVIEAIRTAGYHNHRLEQHSDLVRAGIFRDLMERCPQIATDYRSGRIARWYNVPRLVRTNAFSIDIDREYHRMLETICRAYEARWHL